MRCSAPCASTTSSTTSSIKVEGIEAFSGPILPTGTIGIVNLKIDPFERTTLSRSRDCRRRCRTSTSTSSGASSSSRSRWRTVRPVVHRLPAGAETRFVQHRRRRQSGEGADREERRHLDLQEVRCGRCALAQRPLPFSTRPRHEMAHRWRDDADARRARRPRQTCVGIHSRKRRAMCFGSAASGFVVSSPEWPAPIVEHLR